MKLGRAVLLATLLCGMIGTVSAQTVADSFEDGDYTSDPAWDLVANGGGTTGVTTNQAFDGSYAVEMTIDGNGDNDRETLRNGNLDPSNLQDADNENITIYFRHGNLGGADFTRLLHLGSESSTQTGFYLSIYENNGAFGVSSHSHSSSTIYGSPSSNTWYKTTVEIVDNSSVNTYIHDTSGNLLGKTSIGFNGAEEVDYTYFWAQDNDNAYTVWYDLATYNAVTNNPPSIDSVSTEPMSWQIGSSINVSANVSDSDGSVSSVEADVYEDGTQIKSGVSLSKSNGLWQTDNLFTVDEKDIYYKVSIQATDDDGATSSTEISQFIKDKPPKVSLTDPQNQTYFKYNQTVSFSASEDDNVPEEDYNCDIEKDGNLTEEIYLKEGTNSSYSGKVRSDLGKHSVNVSCTDNAGNTDFEAVDYTVEQFKIDSTSASSPVYETTNQSFTADLTTGKMVNKLQTKLYYENQNTETETIQNSGVNQFSQILTQETPLVTNNATSKNWKFGFKVNYTGFNGNTQELNINSSQKSQEIWWSYYLEKSFYTPDKKYIETEDLEHNAQIHTETKKADLSGTTTYKRNSDTAEMQITDSNNTQSTFQGVIDTGIADSFNQSSFNTESEIKIEFNGNSRSISTGNDQLELYRIQLFQNSNPGSLNTAKALEFDVNYEEEGYDTKTILTMDLSVWKNEDEKIRRFQYKEQPAQTHSYHIYPSWAEYTFRTKPYPEQTKFDLIQYFNQDTGKARRSYFFPTTQKLNNQTTTVPLKTINRSETQQIDFEVSRSGGEPAKNTYCRVDRKFGGGDFETVFMIKTGSEGNSQSFAEVNEIYYSFTCYKNGEVIEKFPSQIMQNPMILNIGETEVETGLDYSDEFDASCNSNETQISCDYQSQSEKLEQAKLEINRIEPVTDIRVCNKSSGTATGTLTCNGLNTTENNYRFNVYGEYPGDIEIPGASGTTGSQGSQYGAAGIILTMMIFLFVFAATSFNAPLGIGLGTLSILFSSVAGFLALTPAMRATLIGLAILAGVLTRK